MDNIKMNKCKFDFTNLIEMKKIMYGTNEILQVSCLAYSHIDL